MTTVNQLIAGAAKALGYLGRNETLSAADANDGLICLNSMLDSWSGEGLASWAQQIVTFPLVNGTQQYTIGSGGMISATRPDNIDSAFITDSNSIDYPLNIVTSDQWDSIAQKTITSQIPNTLWYDSQYPLGVINIFPIPLLTYTVTIQAILQQQTFSSQTQVMSAPPGYEAAFRLNLALQLMTMGFPSLLPPTQFQMLVNNASDAKANIKRKNIKAVESDYDGAIVSNSYATYNVYSDGFPRA